MRDSILILILIGISVLTVIGFNTIYAYDSAYFFMCEIVEVEPFYNCDRKWIVVLENKILLTIPNNKTVFGYAVHDNILNDLPISAVYPEIMGHDDKEWLVIGLLINDHCWDGVCYPLLWHEIKHLICNCNWHLDMKQMRDYQ